MLSILAEKIHDNRFLRLVRNMLTAGYLEDWTWGATLSGAPQGGVASPILSNIYLHKLDQFVETVLIPEYTRGKRRARNPAYLELQNRWRKPAGAATGPRPGRCVSGWSACPARIRTIRATGGCATCDTQTITCSGSPDRRPRPRRSNSAWRQFLRDELKLELSQDKTLITHARTGAARFLGYEITIQHNDTKKTGRYRRGQRPGRTPCPTGRDQGQVRPLPASRQTREADGPDQRQRPHHRGDLRGRLPGHRPVLPAGRRCLPAAPAALGHGDFHAQDPGGQAPLVGVEDGRQAQGQNRHTERAPQSASRPASSAKAGSHWWHGSVGFRSNGRRWRTLADRRAGPGGLSAEGTHHETPGGYLRDLRKQTGNVQVHHVRSSRRSRTCRTGSLPTGRASWRTGAAKPSWSATPATTTSNRNGRQTTHAVVTGEPDDRETVMSGSAGGRAEKDSPHGGHLAARPTQPPGGTASDACASAGNGERTYTKPSSISHAA